jgi:hypothetical protein
MAILTGTSKTRFPAFTDPNIGAGSLLERGERAVLDFLSLTPDLFETKYVEDGVQNVPGFSTIERSFAQIKQPSKRKVFTQRTQATIFVKKRMFSTLRSNYDVKFLNEKEKLFLKASKRLFERKTQELAFYESLSNIESIFNNDGFINIDKVSDSILNSLINVIGQVFPGAQTITSSFLNANNLLLDINDIVSTNPVLAPFSKLLLQLINLQQRNQRSKANEFTTWVYDPDNPDVTGVGVGVGVIELNQVESFSTTVSRDPGAGSANFVMQDPYRIMVITDDDVEIALREAIAEKDSPREQVQDRSERILNQAETLDQELNEARRIRGVSEVNFQFLLSADKVVGTLVQTGEEFDRFTASRLISPEQAFIGTELIKTFEIFSLLETYNTLQKRSINLFQTINEKFSSVRQRLRNEFVGQSLIQQMDLMHVFINSNTREITPNETGFFENVGDLINGDFSFAQDSLDISAIEAERVEIAPDVPFLLYLQMRDRTVFRQDGVQVFCGLVDSVNTSYTASNGVFSISVSCKDNTEFLRISKVNFNPSLAQPKAMLEDPLTPFELDIDPGTGLVKSEPKLSDENEPRLRYMRFDDGFNSGERVNDKNVWQDVTAGGRIRTFQHAPGMIYKWKQGIIAETLNVNLRKPLNGVGSTVADVVENYGVTTFTNPFAGLDAADVLSILITGRPHNYATFLKHSLDIGSFTLDNTNQNKFYFNYLFDFLERESHIHGNFIPAVPSPINPQVATEAFRTQKALTGLNTELFKKQQELAKLNDRLRAKKGGQSGNFVSNELSAVRGAIDDIKTQIAELNRGTQQGLNTDPDNQKGVSLGTAGNEVFVNFSEEELPELSRRLKYRLKKKAEDVRYNLDQNYFVVSEQYDADTDIQAFAKNLKKKPAELFNSEYKSPFELCVNAADPVGFEFFADSQGNIVFRPPEYNKTPLSLLSRILNLGKTEGVNLAPEFLQSLFSSREERVTQDITLVELEILENLILLGNPINLSAPKIGTAGLELSLQAKTASDENGVRTLYFIDEDRLLDLINAESIFNQQDQEGLALRGLQTSFTNPIDLIDVRNQILDIKGQQHKKKDSTNEQDVFEAQDDIKQQTTGGSVNASVNRLRITNDIAKLVSRRQLLGRALNGLQKNLKEFQVKESELTRTDITTPSGISNQLKETGPPTNLPVIPKFMEPLIENDLANEDGWRSGKRFIVMDDVIISMKLTAATPDFNRVEVIGNQDFLSSGQDGSLGGIPLVLWAGAVDFDSWRQFGYKVDQPVHRADFVDGETQCAPYAIFKLQEQRKKIHRGSITVMGNEFYQVGDVIYLNNRSMLYYVTAVDHSFDFGSGNFQTTLELSFGRALGEYIPTTLDVIGKGMIASQRKAVGNIKANRNTVGANHVFHLGTLFLPEYNTLDLERAPSIQKAFIGRKQNRDIVMNAIKKAEGKINKNQGDVRIEVRTYFLNSTATDDLDILRNVAITRFRAFEMGRWVRNMLSKAEQESDSTADNKLTPEHVAQIKPIDFSPGADLNDRQKLLRRFPSSQAWAGLNPFVANDGVGLPVNAIDIMFVAEKSRFGDQPNINLEEGNDEIVPLNADASAVFALEGLGFNAQELGVL